MGIEWSSNLATGVDWQDRHHKELFKRINRLLDAMSAGYGKDEVREIFKFLDEYFVVHFEAEERAMNKYNYPGTVGHLSAPPGFIDKIAALRQEFENGASTGLVIKVQREVVDWLINHIGDLDKKLGSFIKSAETEMR